MKPLNLALLLLPFTSKAIAQEIALFPQGHLKEPITYIEKDDWQGNKVGGQRVCRKTDVGEPTLTIYKAGRPTREDMTIIVCPGGGYNLLAYDLEGTEICKMLNDEGYNAALLKYRVPRRPDREKHQAPLEDLQRAISLLRSCGKKYGVGTDQIGVMGFSAGAHLTVASCCNNRSYTPIDQVDTASHYPDFCALIYPAYLSGNKFELADDVSVGSTTPPTFIVQSQDDKQHINSSLFYYYALKEAGIAATMHIYNSGGHGYGIRKTGNPSQEWYREFLKWLE